MKSVDIIVPVYSGNLVEMGPNITQQIDFFRKNLNGHRWKIVIAINGKNAGEIIDLAKDLSKKYKEVSYIYTEVVGKGAGVLAGWERSDACLLYTSPSPRD